MTPNEQEKRALKQVDPKVVEYLRRRLADRSDITNKIGEQDWLLRQSQGRALELKELLALMDPEHSK